MRWRWLHISDIHIDVNAKNGKVVAYRRHLLNGLKDILCEQKPLDCIIFTGDLFDKGKLTQQQINSAVNFIKEIYKICCEASQGKWKWQENEPMTRFFYCPGNHDVLREAYHIDDTGSALHRKDILERAEENGCFAPKEEEYALLTKNSFGAFEGIMKRIVSQDSYHSSYPFEYKMFFPPGEENAQTVSALGINTALLAGRDFPENIVSEELEESYNRFQQANARFDTLSALEEYKKYHMAALKKLGHMMNDERNLCFISQNAQTELDNLLYNCKIPIVFGHHPLTFFGKEAMDQFENFTDKHKIFIYLCGHIHKATGGIVFNSPQPFWEFENKNHIYQISVGGIFLDNNNYNQASFAIGEIDLPDGSAEAILNTTIYVFSPDIFGDEKISSYNKKANIGVNINYQATTPKKSSQEKINNTFNPVILEQDGKTVPIQESDNEEHKEKEDNHDSNKLTKQVLSIINKRSES